MTKVTLIYRSRLRGRYSIETLFSQIAGAFSEEVNVSEFHLSTKWGSVRDILSLWRSRSDVYHITGDVHYLALILPRTKTVVTVHDLNHYRYDLHGLRKWVLKKLWFDWPLSRAEVVTAISADTKMQLDTHFPKLAYKTTIIENCVSARYSYSPRVFASAVPRILFIGTAPWKNLGRLAEALQGLSCTLVVVGALSQQMRVVLDKYGLDYESHSGLSDDELVDLYVRADMVAFPSEREGFGLPILEAQATGRPVLTSNLSPMREVAGDGACLVDPFDVSDIRDGVIRIIDDAVYRQSLVKAGLVNVQRYTPTAIASRYCALYSELVARRGVRSRDSDGGVE